MTTPDALADWAEQLSTALGLDDGMPVEIGTVLDLARDAAHGVARPAAPLTTFLVGYAAALQGGSSDDLAAAIAIARRLAAESGTAESGTAESGTAEPAAES